MLMNGQEGYLGMAIVGSAAVGVIAALAMAVRRSR